MRSVSSDADGVARIRLVRIGRVFLEMKARGEDLEKNGGSLSIYVA